MSRYEEMQTLIETYGDATRTLIRESSRLGYAIIDGLPEYLGCEKRRVRGIPPEGPVNITLDYRDECFSFHKKGTNFLEPITMGLYIEFGNRGGRGSTWVIIGIEFWLRGSRMMVTADQEFDKSVSVELVDDRDLKEVFDMIYEAAKSRFSVELDDSRERSKIGFIER